MALHRALRHRFLTRPFAEVLVDDRRTYKGIEIVVASLHVQKAVAPLCNAQNLGLLLPTSGAFPISLLACWNLGKTAVPLNYLLKQGELQYVIDNAELDTIVASRALLDFLGYEPKIKNLIILEGLSFKGLPPLGPLFAPAKTTPDDLAVLIYTSGTSGKPKGVMLTHAALKANAEQGTEHFSFASGSDVMVGVLPQFHAYGLTQLTLTPLLKRMKVVYTARFNPKKIIDLIRTHNGTVMVGIPSMFNALAGVKSAGPDDVKSLRLAVSGAEPLPPRVAERFKDKYDVTICEGYGMTEMAPFTHANTPDQHKPGTVGPAGPRVEQKIADPATNETLPPNTDGEVRLRGPNQMKGYFKLDDATKDAFDDDGYYRTGDMGQIDDDGYLKITGRIKEMMIVGGENVFPREIEEVIERHPHVGACGCIPRQDDTRGEVPVAFYDLLPDNSESAPDEDTMKREILDLCREHLAGYKVPKNVTRLEALPRNPTGKILRKELKPLASS